MLRAAAFGVLLLLSPPAPDPSYEIGAGDVLRVAVFGQPDMTGEFPVDGQGLMTFPFLGKVKASGLSPVELERKLTTLLGEGYLKRPHVSVAVKEFHSQRVFVTGEVARPGPYGLRQEKSLLALLGDVGELTPSAGHEVLIIRPPKSDPAPDPGIPTDSPSPAPTPSPSPSPLILQGLPGEVPGSEVFHVSLRELRSGNPDKDFRLEPGDTVYFPKAAQVYVTGYVNRPGSFRFEEGTTVLQALALAGGISEKGSSGGVRIVRIVAGKKKEVKAKPTDFVQPEDTIMVPERFF
jgi:polysaccharide biosynthesis/export protein